MRDGGRRVEAYYVRGIVEVRTTVHLTMRLVMRLNQLLMQSGAASAGSGLWRAALPAFVVLDLVTWLVLRRSERFGLAWRLPLDALDAAFWTASPEPESGQYDYALLIAFPLALEAGVRLGWRGLVVPVALAVATAAVAVADGKPVKFMGVAWLVLSVVMGMAFFRYCRHLDRRSELERQRVLQAARRRAYLAGQNQVAMGASSAVDAIEGLVPVLGPPEAGSALWRLADGWKSDLSASTTQEAKYLQVAVLEWERLHNRHPDLSGVVKVQVDEGHGTTLLTAAQAGDLRSALDALELRGTVTVRLIDPDAERLPGQELRLQVDGRVVVVRADRRSERRPIDPCAATYFWLAILAMLGTLHELGDIPVPAAAAQAAICVVVGVVSHRWIVAHGRKARPPVFLLAVATATVLTMLSAFIRVPVTADGDPLLGFGISLLLLSFLGGFYWSSLPGRQWLVPAAAAWNIVLGVLVFPAPGSLRMASVVGALAYNLFPFFPCRHLSQALDRAAAHHAESLEAVDEGTERAAFLAGRESVIALVREAREDALRQLKLLEPQLEARIADLAAARLKEVDRRLQGIQSERASLSSTTTS
ncbi:MAG: hypothetical protein M3203_02225 [Actinomycetota bacterium]|nr:hypothetical protein [Actinomycetota bacterium]